jgi:hypothetical protein
MYDITFIGYGVATLCTLLALRGPVGNIAIIDPHYIGGNLAKYYNTVQSNTTWGQFIEAITPFIPPVQLRALKAKHPVGAITPLGKLVGHLANLVPHYNRLYPAIAKEAHFSDGTWTISLEYPPTMLGHKCIVFPSELSIKTKKLILCTGAQPRTYNYPVPQLPLEILLNSSALAKTFKQNDGTVADPHILFEELLESRGLVGAVNRLDSIVILGASHSGTLAAARAAEAGLNVSLIYRGDGPAFKYARDGHYDGIKQEAALIADKIMAGKYPTIKVMNSADDDAHNAIATANWITYACGFEPAKTIKLFVDGAEVNAGTYDAVTGALTEAPQAWGFGIAYPNSTVVGSATYYDVSIPAFLTHISRNLSAISR